MKLFIQDSYHKYLHKSSFVEDQDEVTLSLLISSSNFSSSSSLYIFVLSNL